jgi:hypothetical protein
MIFKLFIIFRRTFLLTGLLTLLIGCATAERYQETLQAWVGHDISTLVRSWGPPSSSVNLPDGTSIFTWDYVGDAVGMPVGNMVLVSQPNCRTSFYVGLDNLIYSWRFQGAACKS